MIIVIGDVVVGEGSLDEALEISREHVERSRGEAGCVSHEVHQHVDDPHRLVFVERWTDRAALHTHFAVAESVAFASALTALAVARPVIDVYDVADADPD